MEYLICHRHKIKFELQFFCIFYFIFTNMISNRKVWQNRRRISVMLNREYQLKILQFSFKEEKRSWFEGMYPNYKSRNKEYKELFSEEKFKFVVDFSCAHSKDILRQGNERNLNSLKYILFLDAIVYDFYVVFYFKYNIWILSYLPLKLACFGRSNVHFYGFCMLL